MKYLYIIVYLYVFVLVSITASAYTASSANFQLWKSQEGYFAYNTSSTNFEYNSAFYTQNVNTSLPSPSYKTCEGYYCLYRKITHPVASLGKPPIKTKEVKVPVCNANESLIIYNETYYCIIPLEIKEQISYRDLRALLTIIILLAALSYVYVRRRRKNRGKASVDNLGDTDSADNEGTKKPKGLNRLRLKKR